MGAPAGNQFWKLRSKHGRDKIFATPDDLWEAACNYFQWCDENPWTTRKAIQKNMPVKKKVGKKIQTVMEEQTQREVTPTQRPYSLSGLCIYLGASTNWLREFESACVSRDDKDFLDVIARVKETIETQQFEGAVVGAFNANIIARKLGLADKQQHDLSGNVSTGLNIIVKSDEDAELLKRMQDH